MKSIFFRRRNYLINKDFQFRYVLKILFSIVVMALIVALTIYYTTWSKIMDAFYHLPEVAGQFAPLFASVNQSLGMLLIIFIVLITIFSIFLSHRIAGPIYRFEKTLESIIQGDLSLQVNLRKNDEFKYLAEKINLMTNNLRNKIGQEKLAVEEIYKILRKGKDRHKINNIDHASLEKLIVLVDVLKEYQQEHFKISK